MSIQTTVEQFVALRSELDSRRKDFKGFEEQQKRKMEALEIELLEISNNTGLSSFSTETHTAFKTTKSYARRSAEEGSFDLLKSYVKETEDFGLFTSHVHKTHLKELIDDGINPESIGMHWEEEQVMQVRKK